MLRPQSELTEYLPPFVLKSGIKPTACELQVKHDEGDSSKRTFAYSCTWLQDHPPSGSFMERQSTQNSASTISASDAPLQYGEKSSASIGNEDSGPQMTARCDGPCQKLRLVEEFDVRGRCDHYLCRCCANIVRNLDSSFGCSAFECVSGQLFAHLSPDEARQSYEKFIASRAEKQERELRENNRIAPPILNANPTAKPTFNSLTEGHQSESGESATKSFRNVKFRDVSKNLNVVKNVSLLNLRSAKPTANDEIKVHLMVIIEKNGKPCKDELSAKFTSSTYLIDAIETIVEQKPQYSGDGDVFYGYPGNLKYIAPGMVEFTQIADYPVNFGAVEFVFDKVGYLGSKAGHS